MISSEVQRTLVKSPPELWAELSDPAALTRHLSELGALGEIRIIRCEPEKLVEWEADATNGRVHIKPSGWGTKVTLSVTRELPPVEADVAETAAAPVVDSTSEALPDSSDAPTADEPMAQEPEVPPRELEAVASEPEAVEVADAAEPDPEPIAHEPVDSPARHALDESFPSSNVAAAGLLDSSVPASAPTNPAHRRGFFARLFGRRKPDDVAETPPTMPLESSVVQLPLPDAPERSSAIEALQARFQPADPTPTTVSPDVAETMPAHAAPELSQELGAEEPPTETTAHAHADEPTIAEPSVAEPDSTSDLVAELKDAEEVAVEEVTAVLTAVLDRLGAAHHRPFSRA